MSDAGGGLSAGEAVAMIFVSVIGILAIIGLIRARHNNALSPERGKSVDATFTANFVALGLVTFGIIVAIFTK